MRLSYSGLVCLPSKEDIVSSNLISRSTVNAFSKSFLLQLILDTQYEYLGSFLLYWKFSPYTGGVANDAWRADPDGDVYYNGGNVSYGRTILPDSFMYHNYTYFYVIKDGSMYTYAIEYSYGVSSFVMEIPI